MNKSENQYSGRYKLQREKSVTQIPDKLLTLIASQFKLQSEISFRPQNISFFERILTNPTTTYGSRPLIGFYCNMVPVEIILAVGAEAARLGCGNPAAVSIGEEIISGDVCPLVKASVGMSLIENSIHGRCVAFVIPTSCDAKKKLGEILNDFKPVFMLNLPPEQNAYLYLKQIALELQRMIKFFERELKLKFDKQRLICEIRNTNKKTMIFRKIQDLRNSHPHLLSIRDLFLIVQASYFDHSQNYISELEKVLMDLEENKEKIAPTRAKKKRLILTGAPMIFPNFKVLNLIEESGAEIVADTLCTGVQSVFDPIIIDETWTGALLRSLAMKYIFASICPCFVSQDRKLNRVLDLVKEFKANGVVNYALRLCQLCDMENYRLHQILRKNNIPVLDLRTDYSVEDTEQLRIRIEAFLETI